MGFDRKPFYVPNSMFNTGVVINHSRMTNRRIMEHMLLRYGDIDKVEAIVADVNRMLAEHPGIEHDFFAFNFDTCGDFALKLFLYAFTVRSEEHTSELPSLMRTSYAAFCSISQQQSNGISTTGL